LEPDLHLLCWWWKVGQLKAAPRGMLVGGMLWACETAADILLYLHMCWTGYVVVYLDCGMRVEIPVQVGGAKDDVRVALALWDAAVLSFLTKVKKLDTFTHVN